MRGHDRSLQAESAPLSEDSGPNTSGHQGVIPTTVETVWDTVQNEDAAATMEEEVTSPAMNSLPSLPSTTKESAVIDTEASPDTSTSEEVAETESSEPVSNGLDDVIIEELRQKQANRWVCMS